MPEKLLERLAFLSCLITRRTSEKGATATEYALLVALIAVILVVGVGAFGSALNDFFQDLAGTVAGWG
jgi:pilus assembly protein Flp/PilA